MLPDRVSNPGPLTYESGALPIALRGPAFDIVNFPFLHRDIPRSTSYGVYIPPLIRFARVSSHVTDFNALNKSLTGKLLRQGYRYHKLQKAFSYILSPTL